MGWRFDPHRLAEVVDNRTAISDGKTPTCFPPRARLLVLRMKKILILSVLAAFACVSAVQAGESCCSKTKAAACSKATAKKADTSVKGATLLVRK